MNQVKKSSISFIFLFFASFLMIFLPNIFEDEIKTKEQKKEENEYLKYILQQKIIKNNYLNYFPQYKQRDCYGFTFIELLFVLSIGSIITFLSFQRMMKDYDINQAKSLGQQIKQIGNSVNSYITLHYDSLSKLQDSKKIENDKGPRICDLSESTCFISLKTLSNEGLLPEIYSDKNVFGSEFNIVLKRSGNSPYYNITGLITTNNPLSINNNIRYDLLGIAMQEAGVDSGITKYSSNKVSGFKGLWEQNSKDYSNIDKAGQLAYQVGYGSFSYSIFLRRDGTLPMIGNLNMGSQSIDNAKNIIASGRIQAENIESTKNITARNTLTVYQKSELKGFVNIGDSLSVSGNIHSDKTVDAQYFLPNSTHVVGTACETQGLVSKEAKGVIISCQDNIWRRINYSADAPKPLKILMSCQAGNNSSNNCRRDLYIDLTFWRDGISRNEIKLVGERITRWWGDGCGNCSPGSYSYSNGVIQMGVNQAFVEREFTFSW
jgi:prepilin-type N-terminal cleavage/methylation domain-containing protein